MRLYFDRKGHYRGFSAGPLFWLAAFAVAAVVALAAGYRLFLLAPLIGLWALVYLAARSEIRRHHARRAAKPGDSA
jgi:hypothetical protein